MAGAVTNAVLDVLYAVTGTVAKLTGVLIGLSSPAVVIKDGKVGAGVPVSVVAAPLRHTCIITFCQYLYRMRSLSILSKAGRDR